MSFDLRHQKALSDRIEPQDPVPPMTELQEAHERYLAEYRRALRAKYAELLDREGVLTGSEVKGMQDEWSTAVRQGRESGAVIEADARRSYAERLREHNEQVARSAGIESFIRPPDNEVAEARESITLHGPRPMVALSGMAGAGKDAAAEALVAQGYVVGKFARPLYDAVWTLNPFIDDAVFEGERYFGGRLQAVVTNAGWERAKRTYPEVRRLLQVMGTEVGRDIIGEDTWVNAARKWALEQDAPVVWTDARFPNEVEYVKAQRGLWFHIDRPGITPITTAQHASETSLDPWSECDYIIQNNGTLADLHERVIQGVRLVKR